MISTISGVKDISFVSDGSNQCILFKPYWFKQDTLMTGLQFCQLTYPVMNKVGLNGSFSWRIIP